jgi:competence ComEA-like helix-hairpin-helix protein
MNPDLAAVRQFIITAFNDEELLELCFDHFPEVYRDFSADMATSQKAIRLIGYCERRGLLPRLLKLLAETRPVLYASEFGSLKGKHDHKVPRKERLDLNHADGRELQWLPGIGPKLAQAIVDKRPYSSVEELRNVPGIGSKRFEAVRGLVRV